MRRMSLLLIVVLILSEVLFISQTVAHSSIDKKSHQYPEVHMFDILEHDNYVSDEELQRLAIERGIIPEEINRGYIKKQSQNKNTIYLWLVMSRSNKIALVDILKKKFKRDGVIINNPSNYYVDQINLVLYRSIKNGEPIIKEGKYLGNLFETIAAMEGDYDDGGGRSKVEILKEIVGEKALERYKNDYPDKYKYLLMLDVEKQKRQNENKELQ